MAVLASCAAAHAQQPTPEYATPAATPAATLAAPQRATKTSFSITSPEARPVVPEIAAARGAPTSASLDVRAGGVRQILRTVARQQPASARISVPLVRLEALQPLAVPRSRVAESLERTLRPRPRVDHVECTDDVCVGRSADGEALTRTGAERPYEKTIGRDWLACQSSGGNLESTFQRVENCR